VITFAVDSTTSATTTFDGTLWRTTAAACQNSTVFVSGLLYQLSAAIGASSAATNAGGVVWTANWASQSTSVGFAW
jgi:hypothetical protein